MDMHSDGRKPCTHRLISFLYSSFLYGTADGIRICYDRSRVSNIRVVHDRAWILQAIVLLDYLDGVPVGRSVCFPGRQGNRARKIIYVEMF